MTGSEQREIRLGSVADVGNAVRMAAAEDGKALGKTVFFVGAGCSISAGIPLVPDMAKSLIMRLAAKSRAPQNIRNDADAAYRWLVKERQMRGCFSGEAADAAEGREIDWFRVYDVAFSEHFNTPDDARELFSEFVDAAEGRINWSHLCLGELVRQRYVSTIITTNFDQLVLSGLVRSGVIPVVCDGVESLTRVRGDPHHPQLIELHGSRHTYRLRNATEEVAQLANDRPTIAAIGPIFQDMRALVVVGYGGREDGIMDLMSEAGNRYPDKRLMWVAHDKDPARLSPKAKSFMATSRNARLIVGQDADSFFLQLLKELEIGAPETIREPLFLAVAHSSTLCSHESSGIFERAAIREAISRHRDEISVMRDALRVHRENRTRSEDALVRAREMRLAGRFDDALNTLMALPEGTRDGEIWEEIGIVAVETGSSNPDIRNLEIAAHAWSNLVDAQQPLVRINARVKLAGVKRSIGEIYGVTESLRQARTIFEGLLAEENLSDANIERTALQLAYGTVLGILGDRENSIDTLKRAINVFHQVLQELNRESAPLDWATAQMSLGNALRILGERLTDTEILKDSVAAYREALKEYIRERVPSDWARTQLNLGNALAALGRRESGTDTLEEAVAAYREALKERTRHDMPLQWALTQTNLANALTDLGKRETGTVKLKEAVIAFEDALKVLSRKRAPIQWAVAKMNLGSVFAILDGREPDKGNLEGAVALYREALSEFTRDRASVEWATSKMNLGQALLDLGRQRGDRLTLREAVASYQEALEVFTIDATPHQHGLAKTGLQAAKKALKATKGKK